MFGSYSLLFERVSEAITSVNRYSLLYIFVDAYGELAVHSLLALTRYSLLYTYVFTNYLSGFNMYELSLNLLVLKKGTFGKRVCQFSNRHITRYIGLSSVWAR